MSNPNYGYPSGHYSSPYASSPSGNVRIQHPRFALTTPPPAFYPRPRSSASKPNPDGMDTSDFHSHNESLNDSYASQNSSKYYSCNESFSNFPQSPVQRKSNQKYEASFRAGPLMYGYTNNSGGPQQNERPYDMTSQNHNSYPFQQNGNNNHGSNTFQQNGNNYGSSPFHHSEFPESVGNQNRNLWGNDYNYQQNAKNSQAPFQEILGYGSGTFQQSSNAPNKSGPGYNAGLSRGKFNHFKGKGNKKGPLKPKMDQRLVAQLRCDLCDIQFTSVIPLDMHMKGSKHAKKLKAQLALQTIQTHANTNGIEAMGKGLRCELCNMTLNSSLQLQTHLEGTKHRNKLQQQEKPAEATVNGKSLPAEDTTRYIKLDVVPHASGTGGQVRPLPEDFDDPRPAKLSKYSCEICNVVVNSDTQLQQHLDSKRHQARVEGRPVNPKKKSKAKLLNAADTNDENAKTEPSTSTQESDLNEQ